MARLLNTRVKHLTLTGTTATPTIPNPSTLQPTDEGWSNTDIMISEWAYNSADDIWYYRTMGDTFERLINKTYADANYMSITADTGGGDSTYLKTTESNIIPSGLIWKTSTNVNTVESAITLLSCDTGFGNVTNLQISSSSNYCDSNNSDHAKITTQYNSFIGANLRLDVLEQNTITNNILLNNCSISLNSNTTIKSTVGDNYIDITSTNINAMVCALGNCSSIFIDDNDINIRTIQPNGYCAELLMVNNGICVTGGLNFEGIIYTTDYSSGFTSNSLINKGYADTTYISRTCGDELYMSITADTGGGGGGTGSTCGGNSLVINTEEIYMCRTEGNFCSKIGIIDYPYPQLTYQNLAANHCVTLLLYENGLVYANSNCVSVGSTTLIHRGYADVNYIQSCCFTTSNYRFVQHGNSNFNGVSTANICAGVVAIGGVIGNAIPIKCVGQDSIFIGLRVASNADISCHSGHITAIGPGSFWYGGGYGHTILGNHTGWITRGIENTVIGQMSGWGSDWSISGYDDTYAAPPGTPFIGTRSTFLGYKAGFNVATPTLNCTVVIGSNWQGACESNTTYIQAPSKIVLVAPSGATYWSDYSTGFTTNSLIHKGYADNNYWKNNGTTLLSGDTIINSQTSSLTLKSESGTTNSEITIEDSRTWWSFENEIGVKEIFIDSQGMVITDTIENKGIEYFADYSTGFTSNSLIHKGFADNNYQAKRLDNLIATTNPTVNDDSGDGYSVGSEWLNTSTGQWFKASSVGVGTADWRAMTS